MAKYIVGVSWTMTGSAVVEAVNEEDARNKAINDMSLDQFLSEYVGDSFVVDEVRNAQVEAEMPATE